MFKVNELLEVTRGKLIQGKRDIIVKGISIDSRTIKPKCAFIAIKGNNFDGHDFIKEAIKKGAKAIVIQIPNSATKIGGLANYFGEPKFRHKNWRTRQLFWRAQIPKDVSIIRVQDTVKALGDIALYQRKKFDIPIIAVTGSNGKTTTKEMIAWVLSKKFNVLKNEGTKNNQIGLPLTLLNLKARYNIAVLEVGTNHPGEVEYLTKICQPNIGVVTNIGPAHLEYLYNLEGVFKEKYTLIENLKKPGIAVLNTDDALLKGKAVKHTRKPFVLGFGIRNHSDFLVSNIKYTEEKLEFRVNLKYKFTLKTIGRYNIYNALAAIAVARLFGLEYKDIALRLANFDFPQSRLKFIKLNNINFIDDTYNSNPISLRQALDALGNLRAKGRKIFVMGDMLELGKDKELFHLQAGRQVKEICDVFITVGKLSKLAARAAKISGFDTKNIFICGSSSQARDILFNRLSLKRDDIVLIKGSRLMRMEEIFTV